MVTKRKCCSIGFLVVGALLVIIGIIILAVLPVLIKKLVEQTVPLQVNSDGTYGDTTKQWADPPYDVFIQFYMFNVTNPDEVGTRGAKPALIQHGPYGYREIQKKVNISFRGSTVSYRNVKTYYFDPTVSCTTCREDDLMTVPNVVLLLLAQMLNSTEENRKLMPYAGIALAALGEYPFMTKKVGDLIFKGYADIILSIASNPIIGGLLNVSGLPARMGFFFGKNATDDGLYNIETGTDDVSKLGKIIQWNNSTMLPETWWSTYWARMINGTDGTIYAPFLTRDSKPQLFVSDICRSIHVVYQSDVNIQGIPGYRFTVPPEVFDSTVPDNRGFCVNTPISQQRYYRNQPPGCLSSGLLDVSNCQPGNPPIVISSPHFLFCPNEVLETIEGLNPQLYEHETVLDLEPNSGVGMHFARRLQINVAFNYYKELPQLRNVRNTIIPVFWLNESAMINQATRDELYSQVVVGKRAGYAGGFTSLGVGGVCLVAVGIAFLIFKFRDRRDGSAEAYVNDGADVSEAQSVGGYAPVA